MTIDTADLVVALFLAGMGLSFAVADPKTPSSRALALCLVIGGYALSLNVPRAAGFLADSPDSWARLFTTAEAGSLAAGFEWILRIARTEIADERRIRRAERVLRAAQGLIAVYAALGVFLPAERSRYFTPTTWDAGVPGFYVFAVPFLGALVLAGIPLLRLAYSEVDPAERMRLFALANATPFLLSGQFVPEVWRPVTTAVGEVIFLVGTVRYHVVQGRRGQFLGRFLSPQVARLVRERGLAAAMQETRLELSVVVCDLRGFTAFSETAAPEEVMKLLREYYRAMGEVVSELGGTIKDYAGDGILTLVGAPIAYADHAERAIAMGTRMRDRGVELLSPRGLGLGVGIASGPVTVGALGGTERLEYVAVGPTVNLASRLCSHAEPGQILVDERTVAIARVDGRGHRFANLDPVELKGFARPVVVHELVG